jgi:hypothetical protein
VARSLRRNRQSPRCRRKSQLRRGARGDGATPPEEPAAKAEATPKNGVFDKLNWPKIRIDR